MSEKETKPIRADIRDCVFRDDGTVAYYGFSPGIVFPVPTEGQTSWILDGCLEIPCTPSAFNEQPYPINDSDFYEDKDDERV